MNEAKSKYSITHLGLIAVVAVPLLVHYGFSEACSNEIVSMLAPLPGTLIAWFGRSRVGDTTIFGFRKPNAS